MADNEIRQKIVLEGEKEYRQALHDANRELKTLRSELKAETAELGRNATEQQKSEVKIKNLKKQIAEQEKIVKTYTEALAEVREKYADNQDEIAKWEQKLNNARTALANMRDGLNDVGQSFKDVKGNAEMGVVAANSFADAFGNLSEIGDGVSSAIEGAFTGMVDVLKDAIGEMWNLVSETAAKANNWTDIAKMWGTDAQTIQAYNRAVNGTSNSFTDLTAAVNKLVLGGKTDKITELLGISNVNYTNQWDYAMAVLTELSDLTKSGKKMEPIYEQIFGAKKAEGVMDLVNDWDEILRLRDELNGDQSGYGLTSQGLAVFDELQVKISTVEEKWTALKERFAEGLGKVTLDIATNVEGALDAIAKYFNATSDEEREEALKELEQNITQAFERLGEAIEKGMETLKKVAENLQASESPVVKTLGDILAGIVKVFEWFTTDNARNFETALLIVAGAWAAGKVITMVSTIAKLAASLNTISMAKGVNGVLNALGGGGGALATGGAQTSGVAGASAGQSLTFGAIMAKVGSVAKDAVAAYAIPAAIVGGVVAVSEAVQRGDERRVEEKRQARIEAAERLDGTEKTFLEEAADALGLKRNADGTLEKNIFGQNWIGGNEAKIESLLYGLGDRSDLQKAQLHNLLNGSFTSAGYGTWDELMRLWGGEGMDMGRMTAILDAIADAYTRIPDTDSDWWKKGGDENGITREDMADFGKLPGLIQLAVKAGAASGVSGIKVTLDGRTVGQLVAPYASEYIARDLEV